MRLTAILVLSACLSLCATRSYAQKGITIEYKNASLEAVMIDIRSQTDYDFIYDVEWLNLAKPVTINMKDASILAVLDSIFSNQTFTYAITGKIITFVDREQIKNPSAPPKTFTGRVTSIDGTPLQGASIVVKGTQISTQTDATGSFQLINISRHATIEVSYVEHGSQLVKANRNPILVKLEKNPKSLETVVTKGVYGKSIKLLDISTSSKITADEISKAPVTNLLSTIPGRVPGLFMAQMTGLPTSDYQTQIRGQKSIGSTPGKLPDNSPVFIIDGVPFLTGEEQMTQTGLTSINNPLSTINPADIESIEILRDANSTSVFGSLGANGVVLITTRKPKSGRTTVDVRMTSGWSKIARVMDYMDTEQYKKMRNEAFANDNITATAQNAPDLFLWDTTRYTNWQKELLGGTAKLSNAHIRVSGGSDNTQFTTSVGYIRETTILPRDLSKTLISLSLNLSHVSENKKFEFVMSNSYGYDKSKLLNFDPTISVDLTSPNSPWAYDAQNKLRWNENTVPFVNPFAYLYQPFNVGLNRLTSNMKINYKLFPWLSIKSNLGFSSITSDEYGALPIASLDPISNPRGSANFGQSKNRNWIIEPQLESINNIGKKGKLKVLVGTSFREQFFNSHLNQGTGYTTDVLLKSLSGANKIVSKKESSLYRIQSLYGVVNYTFNNKYLFEFTGRRDGSSRFGPNRQFGNFGSVATGWIFSNEKFIKEAFPFLSYGKARLTFGTSGNDQIGDYRYLDGWANASGYPTQIPAFRPTNLYNNEYRWEVHKSVDIGIDVGFAKNKVLVSAIWNRSSTDNQLMLYQLPSQTGFNYVLRNSPGKVGNKNFEVEVSTINIRKDNIKWSTSANVSISRNKLLYFPLLASSEYRTIFVEGQPLNLQWGYRSAGVDPETGYYRFYDRNGKLVDLTTGATLSDSDLVKIDTYNPNFYGGLQNSFQYKNWRFDVLFQFVMQKGYNPIPATGVNTGYPLFNSPAAFQDRWEKPGDQAQYQKFSQDATSTASIAAYYYANSDAQITDASYIRLKTISLSYSLPNKWMERLKFKSCSISLQGQNILTITSYKGNDPESGTINRLGLPPLKTYAISIQASF